MLQKVKKRCLMLSPTVNAGLEPEATINDFVKDPRLIGRGGFGEVWKVTHKATNKIFCIKMIKKEMILKQNLLEQTNREIEIMYIINNPHCLRLKNHFEDDDYFYLVMPLASKGQLYRILRRLKKFDEKTAAQILRETISALQYLHSFKPPIIHRDLKPENLLLNEKGRIYLADFGWSNYGKDDDKRKTFCGTPEYIAPEMIKKEGHDYRVDIWSIGVLMFELLAGYSPFAAQTHSELYSNIKKLKIHWPNDMPPLARDLISKILKINPEERLSFDKILQHKWFRSQKEIFPLLENKYKTTKDLLMFHMLNKVTPEVETKINHLLGLNDISVTPQKEEPEKPENTKKKSILKQIEESSSLGPISQNITDERISQQNLEIQKLRTENLNLQSKLLTSEGENKTLKTENEKLKQSSNKNNEEELKNCKAEIQRLQVMDKERYNLLSELEEKNNKIRELTSKIQLITVEKEEKEKNEETLQNQIKELNKQLSLKDLTEQYLNKKVESLTKEKEQYYFDSQKKIESMQMKLLDSSSTSASSEDNLSKVITQLNDNISELKIFFDKKFSNFMENFESFKKEYEDRDEQFKEILNEKSKGIEELANQYTANMNKDIEKQIEKAMATDSNIKKNEKDWYTKISKEFMEYKKKGCEMELQLSKLTLERDKLKEENKLLVEQFENINKTHTIKETNFDRLSEAMNKLKSKIVDFKTNQLINYNNDRLIKEFDLKFKDDIDQKDN